MQTLLIIFALSLIGLLVMIYQGVSHIRKNGFEHDELGMHPIGKHIRRIGKKNKVILNYAAHSSAIVASRLWARISHQISLWYGKLEKRIEDYFMHKHENNINKNVKTQSILLTTIKAYKKEIQKLKQKIEPDEMRARDEIKKE